MWRREAATTAAGTAALLSEHFFGGDYCVAVDGHCVFYIPGVTSGVGDHYGDVASAGYAEDEIFEYTVSAAVAAGIERLNAGLQTLR